ncbi:MAG: ammonium transporter [Clostridiales Family XIII bacterium]|jgi:Amt family ammonium transporter|nr:ammonium transporter [Clostridiales Family XIII bacterium]
MFSSVDTIWVLFGAALVFFMQPGFAMLEAGLIRAKNVGNIIMKNIMDLSIGAIVYWAVGFGLMFGASTGGFFGAPDLFLSGDVVNSAAPEGVAPWAFMIFQTVFCATAATIVSGAMAERTKFSAYCIYSIVISMIVYPVSGHWIWGGGWLASLGFHDFAGSTAVHLVGGVAAFVGASLVGARVGKYSKSGKSRAIPGHSLSLAALGVFILWFGWFGFNGASTVSATGDDIIASMGVIFANTNIAAAAGATIVMLVTWILYKKPDVSMTLNGALAGLVGITAGCDATNMMGATLTGLISGLVVVGGIAFIDKKLKVDDPVGAIGVHGLCGAAGTLCVGLFAVDGGLFFGGGFRTLGIQALGVLSVAVWVGVTMFITFAIIKTTVGLRVSKEEEVEGLDIHEHGIESSYADFMPMVQNGAGGVRSGRGYERASAEGSAGERMAADIITGSAGERMAADIITGSAGERMAADETKLVKMTKLSIITRQSMFDALEAAMSEIGITGLTVTNLLGYGAQKGHSKYYRGVEVQSRLLPKIRVEIVVSKVPVRTVVEAAKKALYTGSYGDGKIFIYDVENVVRVRTGAEGYDALQDE